MFKSDHLKFMSALVVILITFVSKPAYGYLDPGTGSLILQSIIAAMVAIPFALKMYWNRIQNMFRRK
ncbi:MAG: hypothetical protein APF84_19605 [Gracilibacter sp. BRH_c7a]|nr:MAG: hypothetical protein APF84_19605 [Gracilibacter sp. BRH_c7a]